MINEERFSDERSNHQSLPELIDEHGHTSYPHEYGTLYDCVKCELTCYCEPSFVCIHCTIIAEPTAIEYRDGNGNHGIAYVPPF